MWSSVLIVAIVIVVIAVVTVGTDSDRPKPPTPRSDPPSAPPAAAPVPVPTPAPPVASAPLEPAFPGAPAQHLATEVSEPVHPTWAQRLRATVLLTLTVALLGSIVAGALGVALLVGYRMLDRALG